MFIDCIKYEIEKCGCTKNLFSINSKKRTYAIKLSSYARPLFLSLCKQKTNGTMLVIVPGVESAHSIARQIQSIIPGETVYEFFDFENSFFTNSKQEVKNIGARLQCLHALQNNQDCIIVSSVSAMLNKCPGIDSKICDPINLNVGEEISSIEDLIESLTIKGYERVNKIHNSGEFSFKGGNITIFPSIGDNPIRIDFFGDEVESIRNVFLSTGQTLSDRSNISIFGATDLLLKQNNILQAKKKLQIEARNAKYKREFLETLETNDSFEYSRLIAPYLDEEMSSIFDYFTIDTTLCLCEPTALSLDSNRIIEKNKILYKDTSFKWDDYVVSQPFNSGKKCKEIVFESITNDFIQADDSIKILKTNLSSYNANLANSLFDWFTVGMKVVLCETDDKILSKLKDYLSDNGISFIDADEIDRFKSGCVNIVHAGLKHGFIIKEARLVLLSISDFSTRDSFLTKNNLDIAKITFPYKKGDYVVHSTFGIAKFVNIKKKKVLDVERDYMELHFAENDKLFLPVEQFDRVTKYVGPDSREPKLTRLNTKDWSKAIHKARAATRKMAFDLVDIYNKRNLIQKSEITITQDMKQKLHDSFPYEETKDQLNAIRDVYSDLSSKKPMDRLICGDVGFGKTEVAIRAAYCVAKCGRQTMLLCPTTILAQQHYETFKTRLKDLGISIDVISRFKTPLQQKNILEDFNGGKIDVLIGTHRLLSSDVNPKNLGLMVIDEEQRFGVGHKEQLKNIRECVDVLTLSATPIPRTLQMSLSGIRDMSLIMTPPNERLAVKVTVGVWDFDIVAGAIRAEMARNGQVYYVSNRVKTIDLAINRVKEVVPEARIGVIHGKLTKSEIEERMEEFSAGLIDIMIATTIIESGIDNPNTNTLIIEDSHRLGLSQMYQLKGRVGRSNIQAYAYFMYPENMPLSIDAEARLLAIDEHQELGNGLKIAMRDLEIRGSGEMFGAEQSGNMSSIGFDLFSQMLSNAINDEQKGEECKDLFALSDIQININVAALLSDEYIEDNNERVEIYRNISLARENSQLDSIFNNMIAIHPDPPEAAINFFTKAYMRIFCKNFNIESLSISKGYFRISPISLNKDKIKELRKINALYDSKTNILRVPVRNITKSDNLLIDILDFLKSIV